MNWININKELPPELETVWACNPDTGSVSLACIIYEDDGWLWAVSNGIVYSEKGKIISECVCDDQYDFTHWKPLPKIPSKNN